MKELEKIYKDYKTQQMYYQTAISTLYYDLATIAPKQSIPTRNETMTFLSGEAFDKATDKETLHSIEKLAQKTHDPKLQREIYLLLKELALHRAIPKNIYVSFQQAIHDSEAAWQEAKQKNDFAIFKPHLLLLIKKQKEILTYLDKDKSDYDYLLDMYQEGMDSTKYDKFFNALKEHIVPLIKEIQTKGMRIDAHPLYESFDLVKQKQFHRQLLDYFKLDKGKCILGESQHPFTEFFGVNEARITTHFYEYNVMDGIFSTIHEYGHAQYNLQVNNDFQNSSLHSSIGFAMHESQSRLMENHIGRSKALWEVQFPIMQSLFPEQLSNISLVNLPLFEHQQMN